MIFERLKELREYDDYRQKDIAKLLNVKRATYAGWETGKDIMPLNQLFKLSNRYEMSLDYITGLSNLDTKVKSKKKEIDKVEVGKRIKDFRIENHLTQKEVASAIQTTQSNIHKYETGKSLITTMYAIEFSKKYSYSLDKLLGRK